MKGYRMGPLTRVLTRPIAWLGAWLSDRPLRVGGALAAAGGGVMTYLGVGAEATLADLFAFASAHPAYPAVVVAGLFVLLFVDG
jgi:hypothetical protein